MLSGAIAFLSSPSLLASKETKGVFSTDALIVPETAMNLRNDCKETLAPRKTYLSSWCASFV